MADDDISLEDARNDLDQARDALADGHVLIDADGSTNGIVNYPIYEESC